MNFGSYELIHIRFICAPQDADYGFIFTCSCGDPIFASATIGVLVTGANVTRSFNHLFIHSSLFCRDQIRALRDSSKKMLALPMYGSLPAQDQMRVFDRVGKNTRKVVIATNIAETSITINGIVYSEFGRKFYLDCSFFGLLNDFHD